MIYLFERSLLLYIFFYIHGRKITRNLLPNQLTGSRDCELLLASLHKMELSDTVVKGLQTLADPANLDLKSFTVFTEAAFRSLLSFPTASVFGKMSCFLPFVLENFQLKTGME